MTVYLGDIRLDGVAVGPAGPAGPTGPEGPQGPAGPTNVMVVPDYAAAQNITGTYSSELSVSNDANEWIGHPIYSRTVPSSGFVYLRIDAHLNYANTQRIALMVNARTVSLTNGAYMASDFFPVANGDAVSASISGYLSSGLWKVYAECQLYPPKFVTVP